MHRYTPESKLELLRLLSGKSREAVCTEMNVSTVVLSAAEKLEREPSPRLRRRIEEYYKTDFFKLYTPAEIDKHVEMILK